MSRKIANTYPSNCADYDDYAQEGYLVLAELNSSRRQYRDFAAYAMAAIANRMKRYALGATCPIRAPLPVKKMIRNVSVLTYKDRTDTEICSTLEISMAKLCELIALANPKPWHMLFDEPAYEPEPFVVFDDMLECGCLTPIDKQFIMEELGDMVVNTNLTRKQKYTMRKGLRKKLIRGGYGQ